MNEQITFLKENNRKIDNIKELLERQSKKATYAGVVANHDARTRPGGRETLYSVVTSTNEKDNGEEVLDRVRKAVDAKEGWVTVERVRKAKDSKVIMGFRSKDDQNRVKVGCRRETTSSLRR